MAPKEPLDETVIEKTTQLESTLSSLGIKYPTLRDHPLHNGQLWLKGKRADDGAEGLWRIHNGLYDLSEFVQIHPGGSDWLELTKGTDITEAFESHHISRSPEGLLPKFYIRNAKTRRNLPFTFEQDGFYKTLQNKVRGVLNGLPKQPKQRSKYLTDLLLLTFIITALLAVYLRSFTIGAVSGVLLSMTAIAAHNFFHQRDNFRMYYFDLTMMPSREWRISHALSHHMYTNTIKDIEISHVEPFLQYLPIEKHYIFKYIRYISFLYWPLICAFAFFGYFAKTVIHIALNRRYFRKEYLLPIAIPILMYLVTKESILFCLGMFLWIEFVGSIHFGAVGLNAAHHHPDLFHDGDTPRPKVELDWGIYQLDAVMDRKDISGSHFLVLTNFGDHALHHLFPTLDHGLLEYLYPLFLDHCKEFGVEWKISSQMDLVKGQFKQLLKTEPKKEPPKTLKKLK